MASPQFPFGIGGGQGLGVGAQDNASVPAAGNTPFVGTVGRGPSVMRFTPANPLRRHGSRSMASARGNNQTEENEEPRGRRKNSRSLTRSNATRSPVREDRSRSEEHRPQTPPVQPAGVEERLNAIENLLTQHAHLIQKTHDDVVVTQKANTEIVEKVKTLDAYTQQVDKIINLVAEDMAIKYTTKLQEVNEKLNMLENLSRIFSRQIHQDFHNRKLVNLTLDLQLERLLNRRMQHRGRRQTHGHVKVKTLGYKASHNSEESLLLKLHKLLCLELSMDKYRGGKRKKKSQ